MDFFYDDAGFPAANAGRPQRVELDGLEKKALRHFLLVGRRVLAAGKTGAERCARMQNRLLESPLWAESRRVGLYVAIKGEADTALLLARAWAEGREVFLPRCRRGEPGVMDMVACAGPEGLEKSPQGILEPREEPSSRLLSDEELRAGRETLLVVPALAFDREGFRLGYGGGYYDRLLSRADCSSVGLAFHELLFPRLPRDGWDMPAGGVCTEEELLCFQP